MFYSKILSDSVDKVKQTSSAFRTRGTLFKRAIALEWFLKKRLLCRLIGMWGDFENKIKSIRSCNPPGLFFGPSLPIEDGPVQTDAHCEQTVGSLACFSHLNS